MSKRDEALAQIVSLAQIYALTPRDISEALSSAGANKDVSVAMRLFSYLGGIFIFAGIASYASMFWHSMGSVMHVLLTFGTGVILFILALLATGRPRFEKSISPLLVMSAVLQPAGMFIWVHESYPAMLNDPRDVALAVFGIMLAQQLMAFIRLRTPMLLCASLSFGMIMFSIACDLLDISGNITSVALGLSGLCITYSLDKTRYREISGFWYFISGAMFMLGSFDLLKDTPVEFFYLGIACFLVYLSVLTQSSSLLVISVLSMLSYISYYTYQHFMNSVGWPVMLVLLGIAFFAISSGAFRIKRKYFNRDTNENPA